jgi:hypothetical protein
MIAVPLRRELFSEEIDCMQSWIDKNDYGGYVGDGDIYWVGDEIRFLSVAYLTTEESATLFRLVFE